MTLGSNQVKAVSSFDEYAEDYEGALNQGLSATGEAKDFFARERVVWLSCCLQQLAANPKRIMDYGCGTGSTAPFLRELLQPESIVGVDTSEKSLELARQTYSESESRFFRNDQYPRDASLDLVYCNGVFHHIPPVQRPAELRYIWDCLRPGGLFALWENNPWNPGTRYVMSRISFDRDAITLTPPETRGLLRRARFEVIRTDFLFFFPSWLKPLRRAERWLNRILLGGQYLVLCRKLAM